MSLLTFKDSNDDLDKNEESMIVQNALSACKLYEPLLQLHLDAPKQNEFEHLTLSDNDSKPDKKMFRNIVKIKIIGAKRSNM